MYKVPLMMILAERVSAGMISPNEVIAGLELPKVFDYIIINSNNDYAHQVRKFLDGDDAWREEAKQYADLPNDYYDPRYMQYCYFSPRYMTRVLETLYHDPDRFPMVIDRMLKADQAHYFRLPDEMHSLDVAQKYGSYIDMENSNWNHTSGIIYTPNPIILTVMTKNVANWESVIGELAVRFKNYALGLDEKLARLAEEQAALAALEAENQPAEQTAQEAGSPAERADRPAQNSAPQSPTEEREQQDRASRHLMYSLAATLAAVLVLGVLGVFCVGKHKKKKRYEGYRRRFEEEMRQEALTQKRSKRQ
jgi:hypothetical protein